LQDESSADGELKAVNEKFVVKGESLKKSVVNNVEELLEAVENSKNGS
jgi:hypothetical protein